MEMRDSGLSQLNQAEHLNLFEKVAVEARRFPGDLSVGVQQSS